MAPIVRRCRPSLGTFVEIAAPLEFADAVDAAFAAITAVHAAMSFHDEASDLAQLRRARTGEWVPVSRTTVRVLNAAVQLHGESGGLFDPTVGAALVRDRLLPVPPRWDGANAGGLEDLELKDSMARMRRPILIDLGGIAKGFAVDEAIDVLMEAGVPSALVNAGGDLRVLGSDPQRIAVRDAAGSVVADLTLADGALATSAFSGPGAAPHRRPGGTALPAGLCAAVAGPTCMIADAMTKVALLDAAVAARMLAARGGVIVYLGRDVPKPVGIAA